MRLVLIDGNAIVHRAYHALPPLTTKDGKLVNAVYGFTSMLLKVINDLKPTHLAVCFDRPEKTFRQEIYEDYQAQRPEMEDELAEQFPLVKEVVGAMKIPIFEKAGYEADDVIGSLAFKIKNKKKSKVKSQKSKITTRNLKLKKKKKNITMKQCNNEAMDIIIVTGDRDILQLVDNNIKIYMPVKGLSQAKLFDIKVVEDKYGIKPSQIVDYKALIGDPSDNYSGVSGIGPKTAAKLLVQYKTLDNLYRHVEEIDNKNIREKLKKGKENALMAKKLAMIVKDVPLKVNLNQLGMFKIDNLEIEVIFQKLGFKTLLKRLKREENVYPKRRKTKRKNTADEKNQLSLL